MHVKLRLSLSTGEVGTNTVEESRNLPIKPVFKILVKTFRLKNHHIFHIENHEAFNKGSNPDLGAKISVTKWAPKSGFNCAYHFAFSVDTRLCATPP